ncbi:MAG: tetratricopeptide repeat protein [Flavobacteriales bacterium]|nr:tetratricopeptide repeat protein [Flavobacteriales bacterium]
MRRWIVVLGLMMLATLGIAQTGGNYTSQGRYEIEKGRYASAIELLNRSMQFSKFNSEAYFLRGIAKYELEDFIGAEKDLSKAIELNPRNYEAFLYRGVCRSQMHNYKDGFTDYSQAIKLNDEDWRAYANRSLSSLQVERFVDVISDCNKIIDLKKDMADTYLIRGEAKSGLEMYNVAIEDFERAMKMDSLDMRPVLHRGIANFKLEKYQEAIVDFETAMKLDAQNKLPVFHRGTAYAEMGKQMEALKDFNDVLTVFQDNAIVLFNRAIILSNMKKPTEAMADYDRVIQLNPNNILGFYNRGNLLYNQKNYDAALIDFNKAIELFPEFLEAHENRIEVYRLLKDREGYDAAVKELDGIKRMLSVSDEDVKFEQNIKLMKLTELKGDFEPAQQEVGKLQQQKVDVRLLPFYRISAFPETDRNIAVYDGFNKPFYNTGVIAFITKKEERGKEAAELLKKLSEYPPSEPSQFIRLASLYALVGDYVSAYELLNTCLETGSNQVTCYFERASLLQTELEHHQENFELLVGSANVVDTAYQARTESLLARAEMDYRKVIELDKEMSFAHFNLGLLLVTAERYEEAETQFGLAASSDGNFIEANYNRGLIRILLGKIAKGCEDMSLAGELGFTDSYNIIKRYCE